MDNEIGNPPLNNVNIIRLSAYIRGQRCTAVSRAAIPLLFSRSVWMRATCRSEPNHES